MKIWKDLVCILMKYVFLYMGWHTYTKPKNNFFGDSCTFEPLFPFLELYHFYLIQPNSKSHLFSVATIIPEKKIKTIENVISQALWVIFPIDDRFANLPAISYTGFTCYSEVECCYETFLKV